MQITPVSYLTEISRRSQEAHQAGSAQEAAAVYSVTPLRDRRSPEERVIQGEVLERRASAVETPFVYQNNSMYDFAQFAASRPPSSYDSSRQPRTAVSTYQSVSKSGQEKSPGSLLDTFV